MKKKMTSTTVKWKLNLIVCSVRAVDGIVYMHAYIGRGLYNQVIVIAQRAHSSMCVIDAIDVA